MFRELKKITLISPTWSNLERGELEKGFRFPPMSLLLLAALAPGYDYKIIDENISRFDINSKEIKEADLIGITAMTSQAPRAYEIADQLRKLGKPVVIGGIHATVLPEEAINHADAVVIGEAEEIWPKLLEDYKKRKMKKFYKAKRFPSLAGLPIPRRELLGENKNKYLIRNTVQVSRGCPFNCYFCSVTEFFGNRYRLRPIKEVVREIEVLISEKDSDKSHSLIEKYWNKLSRRIVVFLDDNIFGNPNYSKELFKELIPLKIFWGGQASINITRDEKLLELATKSGCRYLFIGLESINPVVLKEAGKKINKVTEYTNAIRLLHKYGIVVQGAFIFGFDEDKEDVFRETVKFAQDAKLDVAQFTPLTPLPGTKLMEKVKNRIITWDWSKYDFAHPVFKPLRMSVKELEMGQKWALHEFYSLSSIIKRMPPLFSERFYIYMVANLTYRKQILKTVKMTAD